MRSGALFSFIISFLAVCSISMARAVKPAEDWAAIQEECFKSMTGLYNAETLPDHFKRKRISEADTAVGLERLQTALKAYCQAWTLNDFKSLYLMKSPHYKKSISWEQFEREMKERVPVKWFSGVWVISLQKIVRPAEKGFCAILVAQRPPPDDSRRVMQREHWYVCFWYFENGEWYCDKSFGIEPEVPSNEIFK